MVSRVPQNGFFERPGRFQPSLFPDNTTVRALDGVSAQLLGSVGVGLMPIVLELLTDIFAGQGGKLSAACDRHRLRRGSLLAVTRRLRCAGHRLLRRREKAKAS